MNKKPSTTGKHAGALSGGAGCKHALQMISWPAGTDNLSYTTIATGSTVMGDFIVGPAIDLTRGHVYFIRGDGSDHVLERYDYSGAGSTHVVYRKLSPEFPSWGSIATSSTFQLTFDVHSQIIYWFVQPSANCAKGNLYSLDLANWVPGMQQRVPQIALRVDETPELGSGTVMTQWLSIAADCHGAVYMAFYKKIVKWMPGDVKYTDVVSRAYIEDPSRCKNMNKGHSCQVHGLFLDDAANKVYFGYWEDEGMYNIRSVSKDGGPDITLVRSIYYERPDHGQYIATFTADLINRDFYVIGYMGNSGGRSMYRIPMTLPSKSANLFGFYPGTQYLGQGESLLAGNCGAANYAETTMGADMVQNCRAAMIQRYPAAGSGSIVVVPPNKAAAKPVISNRPLKLGVSTCNAQTHLPGTRLESDRRLFYGFDHRLGWHDVGAGELREMKGPGELAWCGMAPECYKTDNALSGNIVEMTQVDYAKNYAIVGPAADFLHKRLYYIACDRPACISRSDTTGRCLETVDSPVPGACGGFRLVRYDWESKTNKTVYAASNHEFPGPNRFMKSSFTMTFDEQNEIVYWFVQYLNRDGAGFICSLNLKGRDESTHPITVTDVVVELYIKGPVEDMHKKTFSEQSTSVRGAWVDLAVDCNGIVWMSNLAKIYSYDPRKYSNGSDTRKTIISTDQFSCNGQMSLYNCQIRSMALDDTKGHMFYSYLSSGKTQVRRANKDGTQDIMIYSGVVYERAEETQMFGSFTLDLVHRSIYASTYFGNSEVRSILRVPMEPKTLGQLACLYGPSITLPRHAMQCIVRIETTGT